MQQYYEFFTAWEFNDVRRYRPEFYLAWLTVMGKNGTIKHVQAARDLYKERRATVAAVDTEMLRILIDDIGTSDE